MAALFGHSNPLATPVGQLVERGTDGTQPSENWGVYMEICDLINETDEGPKDAVKAIRKRLNQNMGKNHTAILYTLTCLETCVKNCGRRFHMQVASKDFLNDMVKVIGPKYDPPQAVQEKVLSMIQTWADAFRGNPELKDVEKVYQDLKGKGIEFPMTDLDALAPIHTPARTTSEPDPAINRNRGGTTNRASAYIVEDEKEEIVFEGSARGGMGRGQLVGYPTPGQPGVPVSPNAAPVSSGPVNPSPEQLSKLKSELEVVQSNVRVMSEMLTELTPSNVDSSDLELLQELNRTNRQMQQRIVELLNGVANEEVTNELLRVNDDLNNVFLRYERFERYRTGQTGQQTQDVAEPALSENTAPPSYDQVQAASSAPVANLIDLGEEPSTDVTSRMGQMSVAAAAGSQPEQPPEEDFDMFAQSRKSFDQNKESLGSHDAYVNDVDQYGGTLGQAVSDKSQPEAVSFAESERIRKLQDKETDYDEMEAWLKTQNPVNDSGAAAGERKPDESISSSEFDRFLQDRATVAETLPTIQAATAPQQNRQNNRTRQLQKDEEDNPLFAL